MLTPLQSVWETQALGRIAREEELPGGLKLITLDPGGDLRVDRDALNRAVAAFDQVDLERYRAGQRTFFGHPVP